ncbi:MAG: DpnD/PcfM family protein [Prevotella sp.]|nr:DpnD/PcfM family protein [Prevotella sp.]
MTKYRVEIKEILSRIVEIEADNEKDAIDTVRRMYRNCDLILDASDYEKTEISVKR